MTEPQRLARHLRQCCGRGDEPRFEAADAKAWFLALNHLIARNALPEAAYAAPRLMAAFPASASFRRTAMLLDRMPPAVPDPAFASFADRADLEVQVVRRRDAGTVLFAFTGHFGALGLPLAIMHRWFGRLDAHVVYLRDPYRRAYSAGIPSLGIDRAATARSLKGIAKDLGTLRTACYGNSSGGYGALLYGLDIAAASVLAVNPLTDLSLAASPTHTRFGETVSGPDLRPLYAAAEPCPRAHLVYGAGNAADEAAVRNLDGLSGVAITAIPDWAGHDVHVGLIERGSFGALLDELVGRSRAVELDQGRECG